MKYIVVLVIKSWAKKKPKIYSLCLWEWYLQKWCTLLDTCITLLKYTYIACFALNNLQFLCTEIEIRHSERQIIYHLQKNKILYVYPSFSCVLQARTQSAEWTISACLFFLRCSLEPRVVFVARIFAAEIPPCHNKLRLLILQPALPALALI